MNPELFRLRSSDSVEEARNGLLAFGITEAPVLDQAGRPVGMVSLRELAQRRAGQTVSDIMASPVPKIDQETSAVDGASILVQSGHHRVVVIDENGRAVGNVSALDLLRALLGLEATHPAAFPHFDPATGLTWSDPALLEAGAIEGAPLTTSTRVWPTWSRRHRPTTRC